MKTFSLMFNAPYPLRYGYHKIMATSKKPSVKKPAAPKLRAVVATRTKTGKMVPVGGMVSASEVNDVEWRLKAGILVREGDGNGGG